MLTPLQYLYPYFIDIPQLNRALAPFQLYAHVYTDHDRENDEHLVIHRRHGNDANGKIHIRHLDRFMINDNILVCWRKDGTGLSIAQFDLRSGNLPDSGKEEYINLYQLDPGEYPQATKLFYNHFITFFRKTNLVVDAPHHEQYIIVYVHGNTLTIRPFREFNETGGDPLYTWPALASLDVDRHLLHGTGMRMGPFTIPF